MKRVKITGYNKLRLPGGSVTPNKRDSHKNSGKKILASGEGNEVEKQSAPRDKQTKK